MAAEAEPLLLGPRRRRRHRQGGWGLPDAGPPQSCPPARSPVPRASLGTGLCPHHLPPGAVAGGHRDPPALHVHHPKKHGTGALRVLPPRAWQGATPVPRQRVPARATAAGRARGCSDPSDPGQGCCRCHPPWLGGAGAAPLMPVRRRRCSHRGRPGFCDFKTTIRTSSPSLLLLLLITSILSSVLPELTVYKPPPAACPL